MKQLSTHGKRGKGDRPLLLSFTFSYILLFLLLLVIGILFYWNTYYQQMQQVEQTNRIILEHSMEKMENSLNSIRSFTNSLNRSSPKLAKIANQPRRAINLVDARQASQDLPPFQDNNKYISHFYFYLECPQMIVAPSKVYINIEPYYAAQFQFEDLTYQQWLDEVLTDIPQGQQIRPVGAVGEVKSENNLIFQQGYYNKHSPSPVGQFIFIIDGQQVRETLRPAYDLGATFMYIIDQSGNILIEMQEEDWEADLSFLTSKTGSHTTEERVNGTSMVITQSQSDQYGWTYVIGIPKSVLTQQSYRSLRVPLLVGLLLGLFGMLVVLWAYYFNRRPLETIIDNTSAITIEEAKPTDGHRFRNQLWNLASTVSFLTQSNLSMERQLSHQQAELEKAHLIQLVYGEFIIPTSENNQRSTKDLGLSFRGIYLGLVTPPKDLQLLEVQQTLAQVLQQHTATVTSCFWADREHLTLLYHQSKENVLTSYQSFLKDLHFALLNDHGIEVVFYVGMAYDSLEDVHLSFSEARRILTAQKGHLTHIFYSNESALKVSDTFEYTLQDEERLADYVSMGDMDAVRHLLHQVYQRNFKDRSLAPYVVRLLYNRMITTLFAIDQRTEFSSELLHSTNLEPQDFIGLLYDSYKRLCLEAKQEEQRQKVETENELVQYIDNNFTESNLSLKSLSQTFAMTESYLSVLIKQLVGETFSSYVETLRVQRANQLLQDSQLSVAEIAFAVGYDSSTAFGRAYKRVTGLSPTQYRKRYQEEGDNNFT